MSRARIRNAQKRRAHMDNVRNPPTHMRRLPLNFAYRNGVLLGGPYRKAPLHTNALLVKLAAELREPCDVSVDTVDFGVPDEAQFRRALYRAAARLLKGGTVAVGCGYGVGRTGTFLAALYKLHRDILYYAGLSRTVGDDAVYDPVLEVREAYFVGAVETKDQVDFVRRLDLTWMARWFAFRLNPRCVFDKRFWQW